MSELDELGGSAREKASAFFAACKKDPSLSIEALRSIILGRCIPPPLNPEEKERTGMSFT